MGEWTPADWTIFFTAAAAFLTTVGGTIATVILQVRGNRKTDAASAISADNNVKITAIAAQTNNIADAVPGASTAPTDPIVKGV